MVHSQCMAGYTLRNLAQDLRCGSPARSRWLALACWLASVALPGQTFVNVAPDQGIDLLVQGDPFGNGLSFYDFDNDGWDDLSLAMRNDSLVFFRNENGSFVRSRSFVFGAAETRHVLWVDYDNDGDLDLTVTASQGTYRLYRNDGDLHFTDVSLEACLAQFNLTTYGASWADYDRDGDLDLYVCLYEYEGTEEDLPKMNHLYRNEGDGTFTDVTLAAGVGDGIRMSFQGVWIDYDKDGWQDLYVINDRWFANSMYRNNGDGTFTDVTLSTGTAVTEEEPMTATVGDFDNDDDLDIFMTNTGFFDNHAMLLVNNGDGTFTERAIEYGVATPVWAWGATWVDMDNDGWQDLYVATGVASGPIDANVPYHNEAGAGFVEAPELFLGDHVARSFGVARGDFDNNGHYDIAVQNQDPYPPYLWQNQGSDNHHIKITLRGTASNRFAIGAWIRVYAGGNRYTQYTHCGENYVGQNSQHHIFGLGQLSHVDSVQVRYDRGHVDTYRDLAVDQHYHFTEGETYEAVITPLGATSSCEGASTTLDAGSHAGYLWNTGHTGRFLTVTSSGSYWALVDGPNGITVPTDTITVVFHPAPVISMTTSNPLCEGDATGSITLVNLSGIPAQEVTWNTSAIGASLTDLPAGEYAYLFVDVNGCSTTGSIALTEPPPLVIQTVITPVVEGDDGAIDVAVFGGVPPYTVLLDENEVGPSISGLSSGVYDLVVIDAHGCSIQEQVTVGDGTGIHGPGEPGPFLYPNPTDGPLTIRLGGVEMSVTVTEPGGRVVLETTTNRTIDMRGLAPGPYVVHLHQQDGRVLRAVVLKTAGDR